MVEVPDRVEDGVDCGDLAAVREAEDVACGLREEVALRLLVRVPWELFVGEDVDGVEGEGVNDLADEGEGSLE